MIPLIKSILAKKNVIVNTKLESKHMSAGEVALLRFASENEFRSMLALGQFVEHVGPPPAVVQSSRSTADETPKVIQEAPPAPTEETLIINDAVKKLESHPCENCRTMMILTTDSKGEQVLFCPNCGREEKLLVKPKEPEPEKQKKKVERSKCPVCGRVKAKSAVLCRKCLAEQAAAPKE